MQSQELDLVHDLPHRVLAKALVEKLDMRPGAAEEIAGFVLEAFGGEQELDDDEISPDLRSVFYELESERLLAFRREEYRNEEGHIRRAFFWRIRWSAVTPDGHEAEAHGDGEATVYDELPQKAWSRVPSSA